MTAAALTLVSPRRAATLRRFARGAGAAVVVIACSALLGWALDIDLLKSVVPGHAEMKANTAVGLLLSGLALLASTFPHPNAPTAVTLLSGAVLVLGLATLAQYATGADLGLDTLLFDDPRALALGRPPGRMSQISAIGFLLLGWKGLSDAGRVWLGQTLALLVLAIALFALSAYGYAMGTGDREAPFNPISMHTAAMLFLLALGWLATDAGRGVARVLAADTFGGELARRTLLPALLVPALLSFLAQQVRASDWISEGAIITGLAVSSGVAVATMIWYLPVLNPCSAAARWACVRSACIGTTAKTSA